MAYASITFLMRTIELLLTSNSQMQSLICNHREEFKLLHEKVSSLEVFLKNFEKNNVSGEMTDFEAQIKEVADDVEHTIQLRLTEAAMENNKIQKEKADEVLCDSLQQAANNIDRLQKESTKIQDKGKLASNKSSLVQDSSSTKDILNVKKNMMGRDDERKRLLEDLTRGFSSECKVIPITGMGGIGKTTLAKDVFNDVSIRSHFDVRAWATISQQYDVKEILLSLLRSTMGYTFYMGDEADLADMLQKSLKSKRYLIVMDDMWSSKAWDEVKQCFPTQSNGSRILLTTRDTELACYAGTKNLSFEMGFMDPNESWNLFVRAAFANEGLASEFETIGKQIANKCQGLPLTIVVVAGLLSRSKRTIKDWEEIAKDVMSFVRNDPDEQCLHVLGLSYNHLTSDLKACLLYFGIFSEDSDISVKKLVRLWIAAGFLKLGKDLEGEAKKCLQDLIDRCLVLVSKKSMDGTKIRSCKVHDLIYELCLRELAQRQDIFFMNDVSTLVMGMEPFSRHIPYSGCYRALLTPKRHLYDNNRFKRTCSIIFLCRYPCTTFTLRSNLRHYKTLTILDLSLIQLSSFPPEILCLICLRYLVLSRYGWWGFDIPPEIFKLVNLQTFIVEGYGSIDVIFPQHIWELTGIRHLKLNLFYLPNPPNVSERYLVFSNVQTISGLSPCSCTKEVISSIQNVKKLGIVGDGGDYRTFQKSAFFDNLVHLHQLETLKFQFRYVWMSEQISPATIPSAKAFPATLKNLKLVGTGLRWEDLNIIGELPNLEVLKLILDACCGQEWHPIEGGFTRLKLLLIQMLMISSTGKPQMIIFLSLSAL
nr:putative late blight resistance protein homolog R1B-17 isoform X2 [Nicotiana tomentosiformis]